jgi:mannose/fructose/N-acetylgalactosamine-specific phosphotransferase system component IIC
MNFILLSIVGAVIMLDKYAFGEFGISQPIIAGTIIGALFGDIQSGIFIGAMLQLIFLVGLPIGKDIPPDGQAAGVIGTGSYFLLRIMNQPGHALCLALILALISAIIGGAMEVIARRRNERLYHLFMRKEKHLYLYHFFGFIPAFLKNFILILPIFLLANYLRIPQQFPQLSRELLTIIGLSVGFANAIYLFFKKTTVVYVILGALCGLALLVF